MRSFLICRANYGAEKRRAGASHRVAPGFNYVFAQSSKLPEHGRHFPNRRAISRLLCARQAPGSILRFSNHRRVSDTPCELAQCGSVLTELLPWLGRRFRWDHRRFWWRSYDRLGGMGKRRALRSRVSTALCRRLRRDTQECACAAAWRSPSLRPCYWPTRRRRCRTQALR